MRCGTSGAAAGAKRAVAEGARAVAEIGATCAATSARSDARAEEVEQCANRAVHEGARAAKEIGATCAATLARPDARVADAERRADGAGGPRTLPEAVARGIAFLAGTCLAVVGGAILAAPRAFHAWNGIALPDDPSLLSEVRAPGAALLVLGAGVVLGAFRRELLRASAALGAAVYLAYAAARVASIALDGVPDEGLLQALAIEVVFGAACLVVAIAGRTALGAPALESRTIRA